MSDDHECLHPDVISGWLSLTRWARIMIPVGVGIIISLTYSAIAVRVDLSEIDRDAAHATERRADNREEIARLRADLVRLERDNALRQTETLQSLTRLETKMEDLTARTDQHPRRDR